MLSDGLSIVAQIWAASENRISELNSYLKKILPIHPNGPLVLRLGTVAKAFVKARYLRYAADYNTTVDFGSAQSAAIMTKCSLPKLFQPFLHLGTVLRIRR